MQFTVFKEKITHLKEEKRSIQAPYNGRITQVVMFFSEGCNGLVDVRVLLDRGAICPTNDYISLNGTTLPFALDEPVEKGDVITAEVKNFDGTENHDIGVYVTILPTRQ